VPVLGHAFVGFATAVAVPPQPGDRGRLPQASGAWAPALVAIAYLPDLAAQLVRLASGGDARQSTHSVFFALVASLPLALGLAWLCGVRLSRAFAVVLGSVLAHDAMDVLQWPGRRPWWPFSHWTPAIEPVLPTGAAAEILIFGGIAALALAGRAWSLRRSGQGIATGVLDLAASPVWARVALALLAAAAAFTHHKRGLREDQAAAAARRLEEGDAAGALRFLDDASRWPAVGRPGRLDLLRGEALASLGQFEEAEPLFRRARQADPLNFWAVADLAEFYASLPRPAEERCRLVEPLVNELRLRFRLHPRVDEILARVERKLER
jgi:membrane-bound metal-dependent hydrolase YbcI (DUF457 family)